MVLETNNTQIYICHEEAVQMGNVQIGTLR